MAETIRHESRLAGSEKAIRQQVLVMVIGAAGSGRTTFAKHLAETLGARRLDFDILRREIHDSKEYRELGLSDQPLSEGLDIETTEKILRGSKRYEEQIFEEWLEHLLAAGKSVVIDAERYARKDNRDLNQDLATKLGAATVVAVMKTPGPAAARRGKEAASHPCGFEAPAAGEFFVRIDGRQGFARQYEDFFNACRVAGLADL
ncbi:ATP-binding protein [Candidatus Saccharibacteria bacterium]|nr:ATP-binding protein [Candidatus Saccharibacteria bacterium]